MRERHRVTVTLLLAVALCCAGAAGVRADEPSPAAEIPFAAHETAGIVPETLSLERAIEIAIEYNPQLAASEQQVRATEALLTQAQSVLHPRLDATARRVTPVDLPAFSFQSSDSTWETSFDLSQPLYTGGSVRRAVEAALSLRRGSAGAYRSTGQQIAFAVRQSYYGVLTAKQAAVVAQEVVDSAEETLRVARLRYDAGVAPQFDVLAAEARRARVEQGLISAKADRDVAWATLGTVLGVPLPVGTKLSTPRPLTVEEADLETLRREGLANRPDLLAVKADMAVARAQVAIARAARQPFISANMNYTLREQTVISGELFGQPGTDFVVSQNSGAFALVASWSLFNGGQVYGEIREAQARLKQAESNLQRFGQQIDLEVKTAYVRVTAAKAQVAAAQRELVQAEEADRIATIRYQEGVGTSMEILDAEANLEGAKTRHNQAIFGFNLSIARLDLALGRDWSAPSPARQEVEAPGD